MQHKLIMETWRGFVSEPKKPYLIYERRGQLHRVDFDNLLKQISKLKVKNPEHQHQVVLITNFIVIIL